MENTPNTQYTHSLPDGKAGTPYTQNTQHSKSDSLPDGVTQDWLNNITDENGNRILPATAGGPEDPEVDAFQTSNFTGFNVGNEYGNMVSSAGDVNGDGYPDVIVGAFKYNSNKGKAYQYFGGAVINNQPDIIMNSETTNYFGVSVSGAGDLNKDGNSDVMSGVRFMRRIQVELTYFSPLCLPLLVMDVILFQ